MLVKPIDGYFQNLYFNADKAGTPERFKGRLVSGGTGNGGNNYTGSYSRTKTLSCGCNNAKPEAAQELAIAEVEKLNTLELAAMPNPSTNHFKLVIKSTEVTPITVRVTDLAGRLVSVHQNLAGANKQSATISLQLGESWKNGVYLAEVIQGGQRQVIKLIKAN